MKFVSIYFFPTPPVFLVIPGAWAIHYTNTFVCFNTNLSNYALDLSANPFKWSFQTHASPERHISCVWEPQLLISQLPTALYQQHYIPTADD